MLQPADRSPVDAVGARDIGLCFARGESLACGSLLSPDAQCLERGEELVEAGQTYEAQQHQVDVELVRRPLDGLLRDSNCLLALRHIRARQSANVGKFVIDAHGDIRESGPCAERNRSDGDVD